MSVKVGGKIFDVKASCTDLKHYPNLAWVLENCGGFKLVLSEYRT